MCVRLYLGSCTVGAVGLVVIVYIDLDLDGTKEMSLYDVGIAIVRICCRRVTCGLSIGTIDSHDNGLYVRIPHPGWGTMYTWCSLDVCVFFYVYVCEGYNPLRCIERDADV